MSFAAGLIASGDNVVQGGGREALKTDLARPIFASARPGERDAASLKQLVMRSRIASGRRPQILVKLQCGSPPSLQMVRSVPRKAGVAEHAPSFAPSTSVRRTASRLSGYITGPSIRARSEGFTRRRGGFSSRHPPFPLCRPRRFTVVGPSPRVSQRRRSGATFRGSKRNAPGTFLPIAGHLYWSIEGVVIDRLRTSWLMVQRGVEPRRGIHWGVHLP